MFCCRRRFCWPRNRWYIILLPSFTNCFQHAKTSKQSMYECWWKHLVVSWPFLQLVEKMIEQSKENVKAKKSAARPRRSGSCIWWNGDEPYRQEEEDLHSAIILSLFADIASNVAIIMAMPEVVVSSFWAAVGVMHKPARAQCRSWSARAGELMSLLLLLVVLFTGCDEFVRVNRSNGTIAMF